MTKRGKNTFSGGHLAILATVVIWSTPSLFQFYLVRYYEPFAKEKRGKPQRAGGTNELEGLGKSDPDLPNCHVIQDVSETDASHSGHDQDQVYAGIDAQRCLDFSERQGKRQEQH